MEPVTGWYDVTVKCVDAKGSRKASCIGAQAQVQLAIETTKMALLTGSGTVKVSGTLKGLKNPKGEDVLAMIPEAKRGLTVSSCLLSAGRMSVTLKFDGVDIEAAIYLNDDGRTLTHGHGTATVTKFLWKFFIKEIEVEFSGTLINTEILGS